MPFKKATKRGLRLRCALDGPPGSGKTYTALRIGRALVGAGGRIAVIDTERGSASKYSDEFDFDVVELDSYAPATFVELIQEAQAQGYDLLIIDSLSHAWMGTDGMLEQVDKIAKRKQYGSSFAAWKDASPQERALWDTMLKCDMHLIATLRTKTEYIVEEVVGRDGKKRSAPRKVGLAPIQREGLEYEFDVVADLDMDHNMCITKTRCSALTDGVFPRAGEEVAILLRTWLEGPPADDGPKPDASAPAKPASAPVGKDASQKALRIRIEKAMETLGLNVPRKSDPNALVSDHLLAHLDQVREGDEATTLKDLRDLFKAVAAGRINKPAIRDWFDRDPYMEEDMLATLLVDLKTNSSLM